MYYNISDFAKLIGVSTYTLRLWEKNGKLIPHHRTNGNHRVYTDEQAKEYLGSGSTKDLIFTFIDGKLKHITPDSLSDSEALQIKEYLNTNISC